MTTHASPDAVDQSAAARAAAGRAERKRAPRASHRSLAPDDLRPDPVLVLRRQDATRLPELVPIRYGRMLSSPFAFFRGAAAIMAGDLAQTPASGLTVQLCGDAHLSNFGTYAGPDRQLVFDLTDYDETLPGPFEWDVKRLAASVEIAGRDRRFSADVRRRAVLAGARSYREWMRRFAEMRTLEVWYARIDEDDLRAAVVQRSGARGVRDLDRHVAKARAKDHLRALTKLTEVVDGSRRFRHAPPLLVPISVLLDAEDSGRTADELEEYLRRYAATLPAAARALFARFRFTDMARKVVGVGSVGTRAWVILLLGRDDGDPLVLQVKEAQASVLEPHLGPSTHAEHGRRVVEGQLLMQAASDVFLGSLSVQGPDGRRDFYVRQLWDAKGSVEVAGMRADRLRGYAELCGAALARAHARSGDPVAIGAYLGAKDSFEQAMADFAAAYADRNASDHAALEAAAARGIVDVVREEAA